MVAGYPNCDCRGRPEIASKFFHQHGNIVNPAAFYIVKIFHNNDERAMSRLQYTPLSGSKFFLACTIGRRKFCNKYHLYNFLYALQVVTLRTVYNPQNARFAARY